LYDALVVDEAKVMKIGIIGVGKVGGAIAYGFQRIGHEVLLHDIKLGTSLDVVLPAPIIFICVPTPTMEIGCCDTRIVYSVVDKLAAARYNGLVVIKSTVPPRTTEMLGELYSDDLRLAFCPEFLRERAAFSDFVEGQDVCIAGVHSTNDALLIREAHGSLPKTFVELTPTEAELAKYFCNVYNALRIVFACQFYDVCKELGADYTAIKSAVVLRRNIEDAYLDANEQLRGFGGSCLPKDTKAFASFVNQMGLNLPLFQAIVDINKEM
jgi:UDPglucose 6-dehydrogenase